MNATPRATAGAILRACSWAALALPAAGGERPPNILLVYADDHASHAIGAYGSVLGATPNIDRLAGEGMRFARSYVGNSICCPARATVLTGKHSHKNGVIDNGASLDGGQQTFPKLLQAAGYQTAFVGKWHLKSDPTGFDHWEVLQGQGPYYNPAILSAAGKRVVEGYTTDVLADLALEWLAEERDPEQPFLLMYQNKAPHREWSPGPAHLTTYDDVEMPEPATLFDDYSGRASGAATQEMTLARHFSELDAKLVVPGSLNAEQRVAWEAAYGPKNAAFRAAELEGEDLVRWRYQRYVKDYMRCIASVDDNLGRVLAYLDESGLRENTVVVYSSDQGFYLGDHGWYDKRWMYEESFSTPMIVRWPGVVAPGSVDEHLVQNIDLAETFLQIAGLPIPGDMQGVSLVPLLRGEEPEDWRTSLYYHYYEYPGVHAVQRHIGVATERYKLIRYYQLGEWELFDLQEDPHELSSVYGEEAYAEVQRELEVELARLQEHYGDTNPDRPLPEIRAEFASLRAAETPVELRLRRDGAWPELDDPGDPTGKTITVGALVQPTAGDGVVFAQGGETSGYALHLRGGVPCFAVREGGELFEVCAPQTLPLGKAAHLAGVLEADGRIALYVNGKRTAAAEARLLTRRPSDGAAAGSDPGSAVGEYAVPNAFEGGLKDLRLYWGTLPSVAWLEWRGR